MFDFSLLGLGVVCGIGLCALRFAAICLDGLDTCLC